MVSENTSGPDRRQVLVYALAATVLAAVAAQARPTAAVAAGVWTYPFAKLANYYAGNAFKAPTGNYTHRGSDFNTAPDPVVRAVREGHVVYAGLDDFANGELGQTVVVQHDTHWSLYAHLQEGSIRVRPGTNVTNGTGLGVMGNTGTSSGAHLHLEIGRGAFNPTRPISQLLDPYIVVGSAPLPGEDTGIVAISDADATKIAEAILTFDMAGGDPLPDGGQVGWETTAERLRQIRRTLHGAWGRLSRTDESIRYGKTGTGGYTDGKTTTLIKDTNLRVAALTAAVEAMAANQGITPAQLQTVVNTAVTNAVASMPTTAP